MRSCGTNAASNTVSWLCDARIASVSQFSSMRTPGAVRSTKPWTTTGAAGSLESMAWNPIWSHTGPSDPKFLRPVMRYPPGTGSATVVDISVDTSLPGSA